uniref:Ig-like domain-containing protein n=1 Tax=Apteryx owenii TaxID=8824 RepID=A0A8B9QJT6_APTOW
MSAGVALLQPGSAVAAPWPRRCPGPCSVATERLLAAPALPNKLSRDPVALGCPLYLNGTERVRFLERHVYNRQQLVHFDSDVGFYVADSPLGEPDAKYWNSQTEVLEHAQNAVDMFCRLNYGVAQADHLSRSPAVQPKVMVSPMLLCYVMGFYPPEIEVKWFKNGREETERVVATDVIQNGDWTYQVLVMLESMPQSGDTYTCQVEHASLQQPLTQHWGKPLLHR